MLPLGSQSIKTSRVIRAQAPANPRQGWLIKEQVFPATLPPVKAQRKQVEGDFLPQLPDAGGNLMWGTTAGNPIPRWLLIE